MLQNVPVTFLRVTVETPPPESFVHSPDEVTGSMDLGNPI